LKKFGAYALTMASLSIVEATAHEMLHTWSEGKEEWVHIIAVDELGVPQRVEDVPEYSAKHFCRFREPKKPQSLRQHVLRARPWCSLSEPKVRFETIATKFVDFLTTMAQQEFGDICVSANPFSLWGTQFIIGQLPPVLSDVRFHGTHLCSVPSIWKNGVQPVTCQRKGAERMLFGKCAFTCATHDAAERWSQFVDIRECVSAVEPTGWFANAVAVVEDSATGRVAGVASFKTLRPLCVLISLKMEFEVRELGAMISPYYGPLEAVEVDACLTKEELP